MNLILKIFKNCFLLIISLVAIDASAQKEKITQTLLWIRYHNKTILSDKIEWQTHVDERRYIFSGKHHHFLTRTQIFYKLHPSIDISQGFVYSLQSPHDPGNPSRFTIPEYRPFQEVQIKNDLNRTVIRHRYRLEERYFRKSQGEKLIDGYNFNFRARYQFQVQWLIKKFTESKSLKVRLAEEVMINLGERIVANLFDQNRLSAAISYSINKNFELEAGYTHWFQELTNGKQYYNRHISRITLFHNIDLRKKQDN